jgi:hypothetical protein
MDIKLAITAKEFIEKKKLKEEKFRRFPPGSPRLHCYAITTKKFVKVLEEYANLKVAERERILKKRGCYND